VTMSEAVTSLAAGAKAIVSVGACASFGGIPKAYSTAGAKGVGAFLGRSVINVPGCPANPDWIVGTLAQLVGGSTPALDSNGRPTAYFGGEVIHERCPRQDREASGRAFGQSGGYCLRGEGCKGPNTHCDCDGRKWNNAQAYCIGVNGMCIGCTEPTYPAFPLHRAISISGGATPTPSAADGGVAPPPPAGSRKVYLPSVNSGQ
jgi:hydrogenase small subunit